MLSSYLKRIFIAIITGVLIIESGAILRHNTHFAQSLCTRRTLLNGTYEPHCEESLHKRRQQCIGSDDLIYSNLTRSVLLCGWPNKTFDPSILGGFSKLKNFTLTLSDVVGFENNFPSNLNNLQILNLTNLKLQFFDPEIFSALVSLRRLDLSGNQFNILSESAFLNFPVLEKIFLGGNPWNCNTNIQWMINETRIVDSSNMFCDKNGTHYQDKPVLPILHFLYKLESECPKPCKCNMLNVVRDLNGFQLVPVIVVDCNNLGLEQFPETLPGNTTTLELKMNRISDLRPLITNRYYFNVADIYLDGNKVSSIADLEGSRWLENFRVFSLVGNKLTQVPAYALNNALEVNQKAARMYLSGNSWKCDCQFTPVFQNFLMKYRSLIADFDNVRCADVEGDENSLMPIRELSRTDVCRQYTGFMIEPLDLLNIVLASLIVFILGKLAYDYYHFKKFGKLPWIITKIP